MSHHVSTLELLPNELLFEICKFLDARNLYEAFYGLNHRLDGIVYSMKDLSFCAWSCNKVNELITVLGRAISRLKVGQDCDLALFPNVRSLTFDNPAYDLVKRFLMFTPCHFQLEYLSILHARRQFWAGQASLCQYIFSNQFPSLQKCVLSTIPIPDVHPAWTDSPSLSFLPGHSLYLPQFGAILTACPNLKCLHCYCHGINEFRNMNNNHGTVPSYTIHRQLRSLLIHVVNQALTINQLEMFLSSLPNLESLNIRSESPLDESFDFAELARLLSNRVSRLHRFNCNLYQKAVIDTNSFRQLHPLFEYLNCYKLTGESFGVYLIVTDAKKTY